MTPSSTTAQFSFVEAHESDLSLLEELRNDPVSVRYSKRGRLERDEIREDYLNNQRKNAFIAHFAKDRVGYVIFEHHSDSSAEIGVALHPHFRGKSLGTSLISQASLFALQRFKPESIKALVHKENKISQRAFLAAEYEPAGSTGEFLQYEFKNNR
jgi:RimJ/RimL family protein N-acetyltransferase